MTSRSLSESLYVTQIRFCRALAVVRSLPTEREGEFQPSIADKLNFYGLYKQALNGDCMHLRPSSKEIVAYAKWKAWNNMRGSCPFDAQIMYINALVALLKEFLHQFPNSGLTESLNESVNYLLEVDDTNIDATEEENPIQWDTNDQEKDEYYLGHIEQEQILLEQPYSHHGNPIISELPMTPELSPKSRILYSKELNEDDEFDNEVATTTSSLYLSTPTQHPYSSIRKQKKPPSDVAIHTLQTQVAALCEEIDSLRRQDILKTKSLYQWRWLWLLKTLAKHAFFNFLILMLLFLVLWRRRSPIAYAVISYTGPRLRDIFLNMFNHVIFLKITV